MKRFLGKQQPRIDSRTLRLAKYLKQDALANPPAESSWVMHVPSWGPMLNDQIGDCTCAAAGHMIQQWTEYADREVIPPDASILTAYSAVSGYDPGDPSTDRGAVMLDVLNYWRKRGIAGHQIQAYVQVNPQNSTEVRQAIQIFGNLYLGLALPVSVQGADKWTVSDEGFRDNGAPGSWGGHAVPVMAYSPKTLTCITCGERLKMSWNFFRGYCDEAYAVVSVDWIEKSGLSPSALNLVQLKQDLVAITQ